MARAYVLSPARRFFNTLMKAALRAGLAPPHTYLLTVTGRTTGRRYSTPVTLVEDGTQRFLVAPYGERAWVRNARAAGTLELSRGTHVDRLGIEELEPEQAAPVLQRYLRQVGGVVRPFFDAGPDDPVAAFAAEAEAHPVFRLVDRP